MKKLEARVNRSSALKVLEWCKKKYGRSKYNGRYPDLQFRKGDYITEDVWGLYDEQENYIFINSSEVKTIEDLASTVIHEYVHYKQNIKVDWRVLSKYFDSESLDHPLEREAHEVSERDFPTCLKEIFDINISSETESAT